jgi:hypothetical protein
MSNSIGLSGNEKPVALLLAFFMLVTNVGQAFGRAHQWVSVGVPAPTRTHANANVHAHANVG